MIFHPLFLPVSAVENIMKTMMENELNPLYSAKVRARMEPAGFRTLVSFEEKLEAARTAARQVEESRPGLRIIGACVYGSHMKGLETRLSDNDVLLIMQDKHTKAFKAAGGDIATQNLDMFIEKLSTSYVYVGGCCPLTSSPPPIIGACSERSPSTLINCRCAWIGS